MNYSMIYFAKTGTQLARSLQEKQKALIFMLFSGEDEEAGD